jgi:toxin FitB
VVSSDIYLVDTNVISETAKSRPDASLVRWLSEQVQIALSVVTLYELATGIQRLPRCRKRSYLESWLARLLEQANELLPFDADAALVAARFDAEGRRLGRTIEPRDLFILATAHTRGLKIATRNLAHFKGFGVVVYDPFSMAIAY